MTAADDRLWRAYRECRSVANRNALVVHYLPLAMSYAAKACKSLPRRVRMEDAQSAAYHRLILVVERNDPSRDAPEFTEFLRRNVAGAVTDWVREIDHLGRHTRAFAQTRETIIDAYTTVSGRRPDEPWVRKRMGMSARRYSHLAERARKGRLLHIGNLLADGDAQDKLLALADPRLDDPSDRTRRAMFREFVLRGLNRTERLVLVLFYYENMTQVEIARVIGISESRVSQIRSETLARLRGRMNGKARSLF